MVCIYCDAIAYWIECPLGRVKIVVLEPHRHPCYRHVHYRETARISLEHVLASLGDLAKVDHPSALQQATLPQQHGDDARSQWCPSCSLEHGRS